MERTNIFHDFDDIFVLGNNKKEKVLEPARSEENPLIINRLSQYCTDVTLVAISCSLSKVRDSLD